MSKLLAFRKSEQATTPSAYDRRGTSSYFPAGTCFFRPCCDLNEVLATPAEDLVFPPEGREEAWSLPAASGSPAIAAVHTEIKQTFEARFPASDPELLRVLDLSASGYLFAVFSEGEEETAHGDYEEWARLAKAAGRVRIGRQFCYWLVRGFNNRERREAQTALLPKDCRLEVLDDRCYAVYDPTWAAKSRRGREAAARRKQQGGKSNQKYLVLDQLVKPLQAFYARLCKLGISNWRLDALTGRGRVDRHQLASTWSATLETFSLLYSPTVHRHVPEFQKFLTLWRKQGEATRRAFKDLNVADLFAWFDLEAAQRKPRPRNIELGPSSRTLHILELGRMAREDQEAKAAIPKRRRKS